MLSTERLVYHFRTRLKTGTSKELEDAAPAPSVVIFEENAALLGIEEGDKEVIRLRRGAIEMAPTIRGIVKGQNFIPFRY